MDSDEERKKRREAFEKIKLAKELQLKVDELSKELSDKASILRAEQDRYKALESRCQEKANTLESLQSELQQARTEREKLTETLEGVSQKLNMAEDENKKLKEENQKQKLKLQDSESSSNEANIILRKDLEKAANDYRELTKKYEDLKREDEALKLEHGKLKEAHEDLLSSKNALIHETKKKIAELEEENKGKLQKEIENLKKEKENLEKNAEAEIKELKAANLVLKREHSELSLGNAKQRTAIDSLLAQNQKSEQLCENMGKKINSTLTSWETELQAFVRQLAQNNFLSKSPPQAISDPQNKDISRTQALKNYLSSIELQPQGSMAVPIVSQILDAMKLGELATQLNPKNCDKIVSDILPRLKYSVDVFPADENINIQGAKIIAMQLKNNPFLYSVCFTMKSSGAECPLYIYSDNEAKEGQFLTGYIERVEEDKGVIRESLGKSVSSNRKIFRVTFKKDVQVLNLNLSLKAERKNLHSMGSMVFQRPVEQQMQKGIVMTESKQKPVIHQVIHQAPQQQQQQQQTNPPKKKIQILSEGKFEK